LQAEDEEENNGQEEADQELAGERGEEQEQEQDQKKEDREEEEEEYEEERKVDTSTKGRYDKTGKRSRIPGWNSLIDEGVLLWKDGEEDEQKRLPYIGNGYLAGVINSRGSFLPSSRCS